MTIKTGFVEDLTEALKAAGMDLPFAEMIGMKYLFGCEHGSHHHVLVGTITAVQLSDEGGLDLHISNPTIFGCKIKSLKWLDNSKSWAAFLDEERLEDRFLYGQELKLFHPRLYELNYEWHNPAAVL